MSQLDIQERVRSILNGDDFDDEDDEVQGTEVEKVVDDVVEEVIDEEPETAPVEEQVQSAVKQNAESEVTAPVSSMASVGAVKKASNPVPVTVKIKASDNRKKSAGTGQKSKKSEVNLEEIATTLNDNFEKLGAEARLESITMLIGTSPSGLAKKFGWTPGNRILQSVRGERPISDEAADALCEHVKAYDIIKAHPELSSKISRSCFVQPKKVKPKATSAKTSSAQTAAQ